MNAFNQTGQKVGTQVNLHSPAPFVVGWYVVAQVNGHKLFCSTTVFQKQAVAEEWRRRWQEKLSGYTVTLEPVEAPDEVKR